MKEEGIRRIALLDAHVEKLRRLRTEGKIPTISWATKMGVALGLMTESKLGNPERTGYTVRVEEIDKAGLLTVLAGRDIAFYARAGLEVLIKELDEGKSIYEIFKDSSSNL